MNKFVSFMVLACTLLAAVLLPVGCSRVPVQRAEGVVWNTFYSVTYLGEQDLNDSIIAVLHEVEKSVSAFDSTSVVSRMNRNEDMTADRRFEVVYNTARRVWQASDGYFDPTLSPLINAYGFGYGKETEMTPARLDSVRRFVGFDKTAIVDGKLQKEDSRIEFNFSAIAKGYGCDEVGQMLLRNGVADFMVCIGGEVTVHGFSDRGEPWRIGIDQPVEDSALLSDKGASPAAYPAPLCTISVTDCGIATSGNYRNFKVKDGKHFGHTIDPKTGRPAQTDVLSATVVAPTCMEADAYATAMMAMGSSRAVEMARREGLAALIVKSDSSRVMTPEFELLLAE